MNDIILKILRKWFEWKLNSVKEEIEKIDPKDQKGVTEEIEKMIILRTNSIMDMIEGELDEAFEVIKDDIDFAQDVDEVWTNEE